MSNKNRTLPLLYLSLDFANTLEFPDKFVFFRYLPQKKLKFAPLFPITAIGVTVDCCASKMIFMRFSVMANRSGLLKKENAAFADKKSSVRANTPNSSSVSDAKVKLPGMDNFLENTLVSIGPDEPLTKREMEILKLIFNGNTNKKIAQKIYRTERTVEFHRYRLMRKLGAKTAADLVKRAIAIGVS